MRKKREIWDHVIQHLEKRFPKREIETWFSNAGLREIDSSLITIAVKNKFVARWIREKYDTELQRGFSKFFSSPPEIRYLLPTEMQQKPIGTRSRRLNVRNTSFPRLDKKLTFSNFITGDTNRFAVRSALQVAQGTARHYNPLYIWGAAGAGKTHLLHAIGNDVETHRFPERAQYVSADHFTSLVSSARKRRTMDDLRREMDAVSLLLFDDVDLLSGRVKTQQELGSIFNLFHETNRQIVLTAKVPPNQIQNLSKEITSRLHWGLISGIETPHQNTKLKIIEKRCDEEDISIPDDVSFFLASNTDNMNDLMHLVTRLHTYASVHKKPIDISLVKLVMSGKHILSTAPTIQEIQNITARFFDLPLSDILSNSKKRRYSYPRQVSMYLCRILTQSSYKEIGTAFQNKDHSTVLYAVRHITKRMEENDGIKNDILELEHLIGEGDSFSGS